MQRGILASQSELCALREKLDAEPFSTIYERLQAKCSLILSAAPVTEQQWRAAWQTGRWGAALVAARIAQGRIWDLLIAHHIDSNPAFRDRAIEELKHLIRWNAWADPSHNNVPADLCTAEAAMAATVALDWLADDLSEADYRRVVEAIRTKALEPYARAVEDKAWWYGCYHNWNAVLNCGCGLAGLALSDEAPLAREVYAKAVGGLEQFFNALGSEGGWDEGLGYWGYAMRFIVLFAEARARLVDDQGMFHRRGMDATGLFGVYFSPNGQPASFGDNPVVPLYGALYLFVRQYGLSEAAWWLDTYANAHDVSTTDVAAKGLSLLMRPKEATISPPPKLEPLKMFNEVGWAALADAWPQPSMYAAVKTGDLAANHAHHDMNAIQLQIDGEMLLCDPENPPFSREYLFESRETFYEVQARAHNTLVVAEADHRIDARGRFVAGRHDPTYRWVACDAGQACGENVRFHRHVVLVVDPTTGRGHTLVVLDDVDNGVPEKVEWFWHTPGRIELDPKAARGTIAGVRAVLHFGIGATVKLSGRTLSRRAGRGRRDSVLVFGGGVMGRALVATAFAPDGPLASVTCTEADNQVRVDAGDVSVRFRRDGADLALADVSLT
ncbi:MAG: heparinase II/III family protein [Phycisphaerae bacterium]|nr:heparinase II/III family protein [Phycisphaerae bacterium]